MNAAATMVVPPSHLHNHWHLQFFKFTAQLVYVKTKGYSAINKKKRVTRSGALAGRLTLSPPGTPSDFRVI